MRFLRMEGPYKLDSETIKVKVTLTSPGNYALGRESGEEKFLVGYVGRSDSDVRVSLETLVGKTKWPHFKFSYAASAKAAFEKECDNYHDFDPPDNFTHPERPQDTNWQCPRCKIFG